MTPPELTVPRRIALRVLETLGPCRYSNATSYVHATVHSQVADWLSLQGLVRITDPTQRQARKDARMIVTITDRGRQALQEAADGAPGGHDEGGPVGADLPSTPG